MTTESDRAGQKQTQLSAFVTAVVVCSAISILLAVSYFVRAGNSCNVVLDNKINPNTATIASLVRLPNIGPKRAEAIVGYRETVDSGGPAFGRSADLEKIKGIGPKTSLKMRPWLCFD